MVEVDFRETLIKHSVYQFFMDKIEESGRKIWEKIYAKKGSSRMSEGSRESVIVFVFSGSFSIILESHEKLIVGSNQAILIPLSSKYEVKVLKDMHCLCCYFNMDDLLMMNCPVRELVFLSKDLSYDFRAINFDGIMTSYLSLLLEYQKCISDAYYLYGLKRTELFYLLFKYYSLQEMACFFYPVISEDMKFKEFVINNYLKVRSVEEFASLANYSVQGFIKRFEKNFDEAPYRWISQKKAERIRFDLESGIMTFQEISYKYLFSSYRSFLAFCKTQFGLSPSKIARRKR